MNLLYVALGGAVGSAGRYLVMSLMGRWFGPTFPYGTLTVNIIGSILMGVLIGWLAKMSAGNEALRVFIAVGVLGGFTTFSAFSLDVVTLYDRGAHMAVLLYIVASIVLSVVGLFAGMAVMRGVAL